MNQTVREAVERALRLADEIDSHLKTVSTEIDVSEVREEVARVQEELRIIESHIGSGKLTREGLRTVVREVLDWLKLLLSMI